MLKKIIQTFFSKIAMGIFNLLAIILTTHYLGAEGRGTTSLILTSIAILMVVCNIVGGTVLVYLVPRTPLKELVFPAALWALIMSFTGAMILSFFHLIDAEYIPHIFVLTFINSLASNNQMILLGKENIRATNILGLLQSLIILGAMFIAFQMMNIVSVKIYIYGLYFSYSCVFLLSSAYVYKHIQSLFPEHFLTSFLKMFRYGMVVQSATALAFITYRLSYYLIEAYSGRANLGVFSVGISLSEAIWLAGNSIALTLFAKVSNTSDKNISMELTARLTRLSFLLTGILLLPLLILPSSFFVLVFGAGFEEVARVILFLSPGILFFSLNITINHYFSGTAQYRICTISAAIGFVLILLFNLVLIPEYGIKGAAIASSISYTAMAFYQLLVFKKESGFGWTSFFPNRNDLELINKKLKSVFQK